MQTQSANVFILNPPVYIKHEEKESLLQKMGKI